MNLELLAERLKSARKRAGLSQKQLAEMVYMEPPSLAKYEKAQVKRPPISTLKLLADALNVSLSWLAGNAITGREVFAERLKVARLNMGLTQFDLAEMVYMSTSGLAGYEQGRSRPSPESLRRLAEALNVSETWLAGND